MTKPRGVVSASLAERGRPEDWADDSETACLCGMCVVTFYGKVEALEAIGFPRASSWNGKRYIPAIREFWAREHQRSPLQKHKPQGQHQDEESLETWDNDRPRRTGQRLPA